MLSSPKVGVLGGGQLGRMLMEAANRLNIQMNVLDAENAPAKQISAHDGHITGSFTDRASLLKLAEACDVLTPEIEHVNTYALEEVASKTKVEPSWKTIRIIQDKFQQKEHLSKFNIPMPEYRELHRNSAEELAVIGEELGYPLMLKSKTQAYDGRGKREICSPSTLILASMHGLRSGIGNYRVQTEADISSALEALKGRPLYAEKWANFRMVGSKCLASWRKILLTSGFRNWLSLLLKPRTASNLSLLWKRSRKIPYVSWSMRPHGIYPTPSTEKHRSLQETR